MIRTEHKTKLGIKYNMLTVLAKTEDRDKHGNILYLFSCDCGVVKKLAPKYVKSGNTKSCGCYSLKRKKEYNKSYLSGKKFGKLMVIDENFSKGKTSWNCICDCGGKTISTSSNLLSGGSKSCGCVSTEILNKFSTKHGYAKVGNVKNEYAIYMGILNRCNNSNNKSYRYYGGRGIKVCDRWLESFENFYEDMGERPSKKHSIDRINNNGNYNKENCYWATQKQQLSNTTRNVFYEYNNIKNTQSEWARILNIKYSSTIRREIKNGKSFKEIYEKYSKANR